MKPKLTYANVCSTLALFVALSGASAYAVSAIPDKSVGEFQLRPGAVTAPKIRKNAVTAPKIEPGAVKQGKIANGSITAPKMADAAIEGRALAANAVTDEKIAPETITGDRVNESTLSKVPSAQSADTAAYAESANPPAFARVTKEAFLDPSQSKGIASVSEGSLGGIYCVRVAGFNPTGAQVTPYFEGGGQVSVFAKVGGTLDCPAPAVEVQSFEGTTRVREGFYIALYR